MSRSPSVTVLLFIVGLGLLGLPSCSPRSVPEPIPELSSLRRVTPDGGYLADPTIALLCRGLTHADAQALAAELGPHSPFGIDVYVDELAFAALRDGTDFPPGAWIVKVQRPVSHLPHRPLELPKEIGAMHQMPAGYDPEHGDWAYSVRFADGALEQGRIARCIACHTEPPRQVFARWWGQEGDVMWEGW